MTSFSIKTADIKDLIEISLNAGKAIMDIYESDTEIRIKDDLSPLTKADLISNEIICKSLLKIYPNIPIISEESSKIGYEKRSNWLNYWLVDPLDGTKEFINRNGEFTTNIAMIHKNRPIFGIIHAPERNETYWGDANNGSYFLEGDSDSNEKRIKVSKKGNTKLRILTSRSHPSAKLDSLLDALDQYEIIEMGSSLKFCHIAKGEADFYMRFGPTSEWDTAAGDAILEFAGGNVCELNGGRIKYNVKESYLNRDFIASRSMELSLSLKEIISS